MKYLDEYRDADAARSYADAIHRVVTRPWTLMEICGGQTHSIVRFGIDRLLPDGLELVHGPGCPVCVTPTYRIDQAIELARRSEVILASFGDMLRVPGTETDLLKVKAEGGDVRIVYSPLDAVLLAESNPERQVVFFAVGFETTAPANALAIRTARDKNVPNFSALVAHVRVPPAIEALLGSPRNRVQGFLAAGHVCTVMGTQEYLTIAERFRVPIVVTGFEPVDILLGVLACVRQLEEGRAVVENHYARAVREGGNQAAMAVMNEVFEVCDRDWRGIGQIPLSGLGIRAEFERYDALCRFGLADVAGETETECRASEVLQGHLKPHECPAFGIRCTPEQPLGAPMVSGEGACAAYYRYRRLEAKT
jgi:hydrogenase expression/formation protein HypD